MHARKPANPFSCHRTHGSARGFHYPALAQENPADTMELLRQKMKADKKLVVGANIELTESEAQRFWPIYEDYQRDLEDQPAHRRAD